MLHRVLCTDQELPLDNALYISVPKFEKMIKILSKKFKIVGLFHWVKSPENSRCCAITFDDGWKDNYDNAFPILKKYNIPATIFISAGMVNTKTKFWFYRLEHIIESSEIYEVIKYFINILDIGDLDISNREELNRVIADNMKKLPGQTIEKIVDEAERYFNIVTKPERTLLNWDEIKEMSQSKITFGSHGVKHSIFTELADDDLRDEIIRSKQILKSKVINYVPMISFPNGTYNQKVIDVCEDNDYKVLLTASIKNCGSGTSNCIFVHRIGVNDKMTINRVFLLIFIARVNKKILGLRIG